MQWEQDLIKDIRMHNKFDELDGPRLWPIGIDNQFSKCNQEALICSFDQIKNQCKCIVEIGIHRDKTVKKDNYSSSQCFWNNKKKETIYLGIDKEDKKQFDNQDNNIYTIQTDSSQYENVINRLNELNVQEIDYLFIDGWHSISQILKDWEYTRILAPGGIVGFHDVAFHPGPQRFVQALDRYKWNVTLSCFDSIQTSHLVFNQFNYPDKGYKNIHGEIRPEAEDFGIAFVQRRF